MSINMRHCYIFTLFFLINFLLVPIEGQKGQWSGVYASAFTTSGRDGNKNLTLSVIPKYARFLKKNGVTGVMITGTTGDGPTVTLCQSKRLLDAWMKASKPLGLKVIMQIAGLPMPDIKELGRYSQQVGADAISTLPELYYKPQNPQELVNFLEEITDYAPKIPLFYYDRPQYSGVYLDMYKVTRLAMKRINTFAGIMTDLETATKMHTLLRDNQTVFILNALSLAPASLIGFDSFMLTESNVFPKIITQVYKNGLDGEVDKVRKENMNVIYLHRALTTYGELGPSAKVAMKLVTGIDVGETREPRLPLNSRQKTALRKRLQSLGVKFA